MSAGMKLKLRMKNWRSEKRENIRWYINWLKYCKWLWDLQLILVEMIFTMYLIKDNMGKDAIGYANHVVDPKANTWRNFIPDVGIFIDIGGNDTYSRDIYGTI